MYFYTLIINFYILNYLYKIKASMNSAFLAVRIIYIEIFITNIHVKVVTANALNAGIFKITYNLNLIKN